MLSKKIFLSAALVSMAGLVACGDDSSSNAGNDSNIIPEKVETIDKAIHLNCTEEIKCTMVYVEEVKDKFFCNGTKFEPYSPVLNAKDCPAEEEQKSEESTEEGGNGSEGTDDNGSKSEGSEGGENTDDNGGSTNEGTSASSAESTASNTDGGESSEGGEEGGEELTGPTGDVVSCLQEISMMGITTQSCSEMAADSKDVDAMKASCQTVEGFVTATLGTACPTPYTKKCVVDNENVAYFYEAANASEDCADLVQKN